MNEERRFNPVWLIVLGTVVILGLMIVIFWEFVSQNVILPIYSFLILAIYGVNSVSQDVYLFLLILVSLAGAIIALGTTFTKPTPPEFSTLMQYGIEIVSRYEYWLTQCHNLNRTVFANEEFARSARNLLLDVLAYQEHRDRFEVEMMVMREEMDLPEEVQNLIVHRKLSGNIRQKNWFQRRWRSVQRLFNRNPLPPTPDAKCEAEVIITFLEQRLEISHNE